MQWLGLSAVQVVWLFLSVSALARWLICATLPILPDEAYYFQWSQHLDAGYFSKGPAVAYTIATGTAFFGPNVFGIRFFAVLLSIGTSWQLFLLTRRWFDESTAVIAVVLTSLVPIYCLGAVLMTIDPLSAFFWLWAANFFSDALATNRWRDWLLTGFAVGSGFMAKQLNGIELVAFLAFVLAEPTRRLLLRQARFWSMVLTALACTTPVWWWNQAHGWPMVHHLHDRAEMGTWWQIQSATIFKFLLPQFFVISPLLFLALLGSAQATALRRKMSEGERLLLYLFLSVFLFYAVLSLHYAGEPNWPAISYLTLIPLLAAFMQKALAAPTPSKWIVGGLALIFFSSLGEVVLLHATPFLALRGRKDPISRVEGWREMGQEVQRQRELTGTPLVIADAYKEAAVLSFYLPDHAFVYQRQPQPIPDGHGHLQLRPASQYDLWPSYPLSSALYITENPSCTALRIQFPHIVLLSHLTVTYRGDPLRSYFLFKVER